MPLQGTILIISKNGKCKMSDIPSLIAEWGGDLANGLQNIPLPVQRNFLKAAGAIIAGLADVPASYLEMKSAEFKTKKRGHELVMVAAAKNAAELASKSPAVAERALKYFASDLIREQENREAIVHQAVNAATYLPSPKPNEEIPIIDDDWLHQFRKLAAIKSNAEVQALWGRILAGEIYKPGSFAPITLEVMARLDQGTAKLFEGIANYAIITDGQWDTIVTSVLDEDGLKHVEVLNRSALMILESAGLIATVGVNLFNPEGLSKLPPSTLGGKTVIMSAYPVQPRPGFVPRHIHGTVAFLTLAAGQLQSIIPKTFDYAYAKRLRDGLRRSGIELTFPEVDLDTLGD